MCTSQNHSTQVFIWFTKLFAKFWFYYEIKKQITQTVRATVPRKLSMSKSKWHFVTLVNRDCTVILICGGFPIAKKSFHALLVCVLLSVFLFYAGGVVYGSTLRALFDRVTKLIIILQHKSFCLKYNSTRFYWIFC